MFVIATTNIARAAHIFPRWFNVLGLAVGLFLMLSATLTVWLVFVFPLWMLLLGGLLLHRARQIPKDIKLPPPPPRPDPFLRT